MAKLKNPLLSFSARNTLGKVITFTRRRHVDIAEKTPIPDDPKSLAQLSWRHMYIKAIALWHALSAAEQQDWQSQASRRHMTGFAWFMSQALKPNPGLYLPLQGGTMAGTIEMEDNHIHGLPVPGHAQDPIRITELLTHISVSAAHHARPVDNELLPKIHGAAHHTDATRWLFLPANEAFVSAGTPSVYGYFGSVLGGANADAPILAWSMKVPDDFISFTKMEMMWFHPAAGAGNLRWKFTTFYGEKSENYSTHGDSPAIGETPSGGRWIINVQEAANPLTLANLAIDDYIGVYMNREGTHVLDTIDVDIYVAGLLFTYVASQ